MRVDFDDPSIDWRLADGEAEIAPGITAVPTYGHTPGHQSFVVELDESVGGDGFVFAFDAADLTENIEHELAIGGYIGVEPEETDRTDPQAQAAGQREGLSTDPRPRSARVAGTDAALPRQIRVVDLVIHAGRAAIDGETRAVGPLDPDYPAWEASA